VSRDPIGYGAGDTNLYRYVGNGPTTLRDPSGLGPHNYYIPPSARPTPPFPTQQGCTCPNTQADARPRGEEVMAVVRGFFARLTSYGFTGRTAARLMYDNLRRVGDDRDPEATRLPVIPREFTDRNTERTLEHHPGRFYAPLPPNQWVGAFGCDTCVGVVIHCPCRGVAVFHFGVGSAPERTIRAFNWPTGCHAVVCGGQEDDPGSIAVYNSVIRSLRAKRITIDGITPYDHVFWGNGGWHFLDVPQPD
jgi:hypothetical protein